MVCSSAGLKGRDWLIRVAGAGHKVRGYLAVALIALSALAARADDAPAKVSYYKQIRPVFQEHCQGCHQPAKRSGGFDMTSVALMQKGGDSEEPAFVAAKPDESFLISQIVPDGETPPLMPKGKEPLPSETIDLIKRWVAEGASDDTPAAAEGAVDMEHPPVYRQTPVITSLEFSFDGSLLAVSGYHEVLLHQADGGAVVARLVGMSERIESATFSPDGKRLAVTGGSPGRFGEVQIWDVAERKLLLSVPVTYDTVYGASWSSDGTKVAFGCGDNTLRAIDAATGKQVLYQGAHSDWVLDTAFSTDNSHVVSVSRDGSMKLTDVATQRFEDNITSITPGALKGGLIVVRRNAKSDELLIGGADGVPKIYKMYRTQARQIGDDFNRITRFNAEAVPGRVFAAEYSPDGTKVAVGSSSDGRGEVRILNEADGKTVRKFADQYGAVYSIAYRPDGKVLAVAGFDGKVRLFDPDSGTLLKEFVPVPLTTEVAAK
ncbi:MAG TPA: c-type cytochrome domain-containing protein [Pirellulales bacterium]|nr:c-type cytochrome domain-containing protein [Pirellulales bacterium]